MKICFLLFILFHMYDESLGNVRELLRPSIDENSPCTESQFRCLDGQCIARSKFCNGYYECRDSSDESYCHGRNPCPQKYSFYKCSSGKCIPSYWKCDGIFDCPQNDDESNCESFGGLNRQTIVHAKRNATKWLYNLLKNDSSTTDRWGTELKKIAIALFLGEPKYPILNETRTEMAYELSIQLLAKFAFRKLKDVSMHDLAAYTNALLVTCLDPRKFHTVNLVEEMRSRADAQNYTNPYVYLTLCNAGEKITQRDIQKLNQSFWEDHTTFWTGTQAIAVMALACAGRQEAPNYDLANIKDLTLELKRKQYRNGTVEDLKTTALVMQALLAAEPEEDQDNFDENKAVIQILNQQQKDGSFGDIMNTYYVLPVLSYNTLANITSDHCKPYFKDENAALLDLENYAGPTMRIRYSLWIGDDKDVERMLKLKVPSNMSFYGIMEIAGDIDPRFRFQYVVKNGKPYANVISGLQDDPESGKFWFLYKIQEGKHVPVKKSPADLFPKDNDHIIMWYRSGAWIQ